MFCYIETIFLQCFNIISSLGISKSFPDRFHIQNDHFSSDEKLLIIPNFSIVYYPFSSYMTKENKECVKTY